jgi:uncharacterized cupredoxin-like copper-binding protein
MKLRIPLLALLLVVALALTACGGGAGDDVTEGPTGQDTPADSGADAITVVAREFSFDPDALTIPADTSSAIVLENQGVIEHDFVVDEGDVRIHADPGQTVEGQVEVAAGSYPFYCSVPGHRDSGMEGALTVE